MSRFSPLVTERLTLTRPAATDIADLHYLLSDPGVWEHYPALRHTDAGVTGAWVRDQRRGWDREGIGTWVARLREGEDAGDLVGYGGVTRKGPAWNLGYRLVRKCWGKGYAQEIAAPALRAAEELLPDIAVTAYLLEHNTNSRRATERLGLSQVWHGHDTGNPDKNAVRLLYADRALSEMEIEELSNLE